MPAKATVPSMIQFIHEEQPQAPENAQTVSDAHLLKMLDLVYSKDDIELKTDLNTPQITAISKGLIYAGRYNCSIMAELCRNVMTLSVSKNRKGRDEFVSVAKSMQQPQFVEDARPSLKERLMGKL
jgi:hypothetical protein